LKKDKGQRPADETPQLATLACCKQAGRAFGKFVVFHLFYHVGKGAGFNRPPSASLNVTSKAKPTDNIE